MKPLDPAGELVSRFSADLDRLAPDEAKLGVAVSGGPDSLALLLLAATARPGTIEAATVDHALRPGSDEEAAMVGRICAEFGIPHATLTAEWHSKPETAIQERARGERYRLLGRWAGERGLAALITAHHLDDQAETLLMRLKRGAGVRGLAGMRPVVPIPGSQLRLLRPLLTWRRSELMSICSAAGVAAASDPSNEDDQFERVRVRRAMASADWLDPVAIARSAGNLAAADSALMWATGQEWEARVSWTGDEIAYRPRAPLEIRRRIVGRALAALASEGGAEDLRGRELDRLLVELVNGGKATLRGVLCSGGETWRFTPAPKRRKR
ncbi:MAG: tRNA lysidine(34) synthetase TilS [Pseudomonadota bacterium]|nr:tRNA lysidine(34) synthetase TilS [Pseudomonadota bacterium]